MSAPQSLDERASQRSTRQLLDELDALMERMLTLPVDEEPTLPAIPEPPAPPEPPPTPPIAVTLTLVEPLAHDDAAVAPAVESADRTLASDEAVARIVAEPEEAESSETASRAIDAFDPVPAQADERIVGG